MRKVFLLIVVFVLVSCQNKKAKVLQENEGITMVKSESKIIKKRDFPIKNFSKIELVSYYNRIYWDTLNYKGKFPSSKVLVDNYRLTFDSTMIEERVILNKSQETELLNLMVCDTCVPQEVSAACYNPRHMILFRDNKNRIIGYNEFCVSCVGGRTSSNLDNFQKYCYSDMETLFRKFGIKLFVDYDDEKKEYKILEKKGYLKY